jgi:hypothetical protein
MPREASVGAAPDCVGRDPPVCPLSPCMDTSTPLGRDVDLRKQAKGAAGGAAAECDSWRPAAGWSVDRRVA